ncbi:MAG TPA: YeeE/YedE thiosulfate transporter family protein [Candidatus Binatia bacterium]|nr:YeeE/YedE thiosulfate transporter family protein [Candidatus Binatia bacterium]
MGPLEITGTARLALGLVTGILFGFILQKAQVTKYQKIVAFFRWSDLTVLKVMVGGIVVGMVGVYALHDLGLVHLHIKPTLLAANILGGLIFGAGMLLLGF